VSRLVLVERPADAPPAAPGTRVVVLDPAWTPAPGARGDIEPIRPIVRDVAAEVDVIHDSLAALDAWAAAARLPDAFVADGVTWWYRARMLLRWDVHELVLWRLVLRRLLAQPVDRIDLPGARPLLATAVRMGVHGGRPTMHLTGTPTLAERARQLARSGRLEVGRLRRRLTGPNRATGRRLATAMERRPDAGMCASQVRLFGEHRLDSAGMLMALDGSSARVVLRRDDGPAPDADEDDE